MNMQNLLEKITNTLFAKWVTCRLISDKRSMQYGIKFSYPLYILIVFVGAFFENQFMLLIAALIALLAIKLPLHPFDYVYNYGVTNLIGSNEIPGRGSELQVNSTVALIFNLVIFALITFGVTINYGVLAIIYVLISIFFIVVFLRQG